jgi:hypothetical protein
MIEEGDSVSLPNGEAVLLNDPDRHLFPGRLAFFSLIAGVIGAFKAFSARKTLNQLKRSIG